eukprot:gene15416-21498_t
MGRLPSVLLPTATELLEDPRARDCVEDEVKQYQGPFKQFAEELFATNNYGLKAPPFTQWNEALHEYAGLRGTDQHLGYLAQMSVVPASDEIADGFVASREVYFAQAPARTEQP